MHIKWSLSSLDKQVLWLLAELIICPVTLLVHYHKEFYIKGIFQNVHRQQRQAVILQQHKPIRERVHKSKNLFDFTGCILFSHVLMYPIPCWIFL